MAEDTWLRIEREYFVKSVASVPGIPPKALNKVLEEYNKFLEKALIDESPFVAENLRLTILNARGASERQQ